MLLFKPHVFPRLNVKNGGLAMLAFDVAMSGSSYIFLQILGLLDLQQLAIYQLCRELVKPFILVHILCIHMSVSKS